MSKRGLYNKAKQLCQNAWTYIIYWIFTLHTCIILYCYTKPKSIPRNKIETTFLNLSYLLSLDSDNNYADLNVIKTFTQHISIFISESNIITTVAQ